jgi:carbamoyl-phosphate synthase large subunit
MTINLFVRQSFTEASAAEAEQIQGVLDLLRRLDGQPHPLSLLTGAAADTSETFKQRFAEASGQPFTPQNFRRFRLELLGRADAMIIVRTGLSESSAFEVAYNLFGGANIPMLFAIWQERPIKTTLLRELEDLACVSYHSFARPDELEAPLQAFFAQVSDRRREAAGGERTRNLL